MTQKSAAPPEKRRRRSGNRLEREIRHLRTSTQAKRKLTQALFIIAVTIAAFILGFYFFGPSFSAPE